MFFFGYFCLRLTNATTYIDVNVTTKKNDSTMTFIINLLLNTYHIQNDNGYSFIKITYFEYLRSTKSKPNHSFLKNRKARVAAREMKIPMSPLYKRFSTQKGIWSPALERLLTGLLLCLITNIFMVNKVHYRRQINVRLQFLASTVFIRGLPRLISGE